MDSTLERLLTREHRRGNTQGMAVVHGLRANSQVKGQRSQEASLKCHET